MNLDNIRTFLEVAGTGNFNRAAENLNVTQSTVSARVKALEDEVGGPLFRRGHAGADLTAAGERFRHFALGMQRLWRQARLSVNLGEGFRTQIGLGAQVSLWDRLVLGWIPWMKDHAPDVALRVEADYSTSQMRQLRDGVLDLGVMYTPRQTPGMVVEQLLEEELVMVATRPDAGPDGWRDGYVFVDWGDAFRIRHAEAFPDMRTPYLTVGLGPLGLRYVLDNGGAGYFPLRAVGPMLADGRLHRVAGTPTMRRPAYVVYPSTPRDAEARDKALEGLFAVASRDVGPGSD